MSSSSSNKKRGLRFFTSAILLIFLGLIYWRYNEQHPSPGALPHLSLVSLNGKKVSLNTLRGKPLVINLWATWCPPCRAELPLLKRTSKHFPDIQFYFPEQGNNLKTVAAYDRTIGLPPEQVLLDEDTKLSKFFGVIGYPTTVFYNANGNIAAIHRGELTPRLLNQYLSEIKIGH